MWTEKPKRLRDITKRAFCLNSFQILLVTNKKYKSKKLKPLQNVITINIKL